jgi:hypothetical protein
MTSSEDFEHTKGGLPVVIAKTPYMRAYGSLKNQLTLLENLNRQIPTVFKRTAQQGCRKVILRAIKDRSYAENLGKTFRSLKEITDAFNENDAKTAYVKIDPKTQKFLWDFLCSAGLYRKKQVKLVRNMSLVYLVAEFESFLRKILETTFLKKPEILASSQKTITVEKLVKFKDIAGARQHIIEKETSYIPSLDIEEMGKYIEQKFSMEIFHFDEWTKFKERFYRRNILIHNSGMVDHHYRLKTGYHGKLRQMIVSKQYLDESIDIFGKVALLILTMFHNKFQKTSMSKVA